MPGRVTTAHFFIFLHLFARLFFISIPVREKIVYDFLNGVKQVFVVKVARPLLDFAGDFVVAAKSV